MTDVVEAWLASGQYAEIAGHKLLPIENDYLKGVPLVISREHSNIFYLKDNNDASWILKKFQSARRPASTHLKAIQSLIPRKPGFQPGYLRRILAESDVSKSGFFDADFASWIADTVLMPRQMEPDWALITDRIRSGSLTLPNDERLLLCRNLSQKVETLEDNNLSHGNLSRNTVFMDVNNHLIRIINWDEVFHPTLAIPPNRMLGTCGYIPPFINKGGVPVRLLTWRPQADRFSLAILNAEFLSLNAGSPMEGDGGMFNQEELYARSGKGIALILDALRKNFPGADTLLKKALDAQSFDECPSPKEWIAFSSGIRLYSCFISYNHKDQEFAQRLYSRLRDAGMRVWFAPESVEGGKYLVNQVDQAIETHDRLLLVLSENSLRSNWVEREIRKAREVERKADRRKLFPIRLTDYESVTQWECMDSTTMENLAEEVRRYFIPDFSNWKSYDDFERAFARLLDDLKQSEF